MNSLKAALSTKESSHRNKDDIDNSLLKGVNKSKNQSLWALDVDEDEAATEESLQTDNLLRILNEKLESAFQRDSKSVSDVLEVLSRLLLRGLLKSFRMMREAISLNSPI